MKRAHDDKDTPAPPPPLKLGGVRERKEYARILVDGYYGDHADMTWQSYEHMCRRVIEVVEDKWKLSWEHVIWVCAVGTWMKAIPITLMQLGLGHKIEFYMPCPWTTTTQGYTFDLQYGDMLTRSMDLMQARLAQSTKVRLCEVPHLNVQIKDCAKQAGTASFHSCGDFAQQRENTAKASTHMIYLPHFVPTVDAVQDTETAEYKKKYYTQGGKIYESKPPANRERINVYDECRSLGGKSVSL